MAAPEADTTATAIETVAVIPVATVIGSATADTETAVPAVTAIPPAMPEKTPPVARPGVTRVGVEAGAVIPADTRVVTEVETVTTTEEAIALAPDHHTGTIAPGVTTVGTVTTGAIAAAMMTEALDQALETARLATLLPPL
jgi:hypothetical protein